MSTSGPFPPAAALTAMSPPAPALRHPKLHRIIGIHHITLATVAFLFEVIGIIVHEDHFQYGSGIYTGILLGITGLLVFLSSRQNSRGCLVAGLVMEIISLLALIVALSLSSTELSNRQFCWKKGFYFDNKIIYSGCSKFYYDNPSRNDEREKRPELVFNEAKAGIVIFICCLGFIVGIVHSVFCCHDLCYCCHSHQMRGGPTSNQIFILQNGTVYPAVGNSVVIPGGAMSCGAYPTQPFFISQNQAAYRIASAHHGLAWPPNQLGGLMSNPAAGAAVNQGPAMNGYQNLKPSEFGAPPSYEESIQ